MLPLIQIIEDDLNRAEQEFNSALLDVAEALPDTVAGQRLRAYVLGNAVADTYEGLEVIFRRIAADCDDFVPRGDDSWCRWQPPSTTGARRFWRRAPMRR